MMMTIIRGIAVLYLPLSKY